MVNDMIAQSADVSISVGYMIWKGPETDQSINR